MFFLGMFAGAVAVVLVYGAFIAYMFAFGGDQ